MNKINKKGFTLVEMLAAVAILGIIATIAVVSVSKVIKSAHEKFDQTQYESFMQAAENYFSDNKSRLPLTPLDWKEVTLQELIDKKYIEKLLDSNKEEFDYARSKVVVTRLTTGKYQYEAILYRKKGEPIGKITEKATNENSSITFKLRNKNKYYEEKNTYYTNDYPVIDLGLGDTDQISGYQYIIYKDGKQFKASENIEVSGGTNLNDSVTLGEEFPTGKYSIKVTVYDKSGNKTTRSTDDGGGNGPGGGPDDPDGPFTIYIDRVKPNCAIIIDGVIGDNGWYKAKDISLTLKETDKESGILKHDLQTTKDFPNLKTLGTITELVRKQSDTGSTTWFAHVEDKAGNVCETDVTVKVDTKNPSCDVVSNSSSEPINSKDWYNKYTAYKIEELKLNSSDEGPSGINRHILELNTSNLSTTYKNHTDNDLVKTEEGELNYYGYVRDNAGNDVNCSTYIRKDTIDPECPAEFYAEYKSNDGDVSPDITFNWLEFAEDSYYADAFVTVVGEDTPFMYNVYYEPREAIYTAPGRPSFRGSYFSELVVYDEAKNDQHCESGPTEPEPEPEPELPDACSEEGGKFYDEFQKEVSEAEYIESCIHEPDDDPDPDPEPEPEPDPEPLTCTDDGNVFYDKNGNVVSETDYKISCNISFDLKCPKVTTNVNAGEWTNKDVVFTFSAFGADVDHYEWWVSTDGGSNYTMKSEKNATSTTKKTVTSEGKIKAYLMVVGPDNSKKKCSAASTAFKIDKTAPACNGTSYSGGAPTSCTLGLSNGMKWYKKGGAVTVAAKCKDNSNGSGCQSSKTEVTISTSSSDYDNKETIISKTAKIQDKAGNVTNCTVKLALDRKPPKIQWTRKKSSTSKCCPSNHSLKYPNIVYPIVSDGGSGYATGSFSWSTGSNANAGPGTSSPTNERRECIGSTTNYTTQHITATVTDCVGNSSKKYDKSNFNANDVLSANYDYSCS